MKTKTWIVRIISGLILVPVLPFAIVTGLIYLKQDDIIQELITHVNEDFKGRFTIRDSHISPFANFPYISIDLEDVKVFEDKSESSSPLLHIKDVYLGFDVLNLMTGNVQIKKIKLSDGNIKLVQHKDGSFNISNALSNEKPVEDVSEEFHLDIKGIELKNIDLVKINEENNVLIDAYITDASSTFKASPDHVMVFLDSRFEISVNVNGDSTFVKHKHFDLHTKLDFSQETHLLTVHPSELKLENALFKLNGNIDVDDDMNMNIKFYGHKPNFDMFLAFAPEELAPAFKRYDNQGKIFFEASISGKSNNGHLPLVVADFGCEDAFFNNKLSHKRVDQLFFKGHFTTGEKRDITTMEFRLMDFRAKPEAGIFEGNLFVKNFESPEIDMKLRSNFDLDFLAKFFSIEGLQDLKGQVALTMNFHDIIDLAHPEKSIEKLNESYFTELDVKNLSFRTPDYHLPIHDIDIRAVMDGHKAIIDHFNVKVGSSDISIKAEVSDLPAILHHTADPVTATLAIKSNLLNLKELTSKDTINNKPVDEQIENFAMKLKFNSSAKAFTESPNLPIGEFFIEDLYAKLTHYPHTLHDFHADVYVDDQDFRIVDFTGMIDKSDFHFNGKLKNYDLWFNDDPLGDTKIEFNLTSKLLQLEDLFSYKGENYVPEDYRHEEFKNLKIHGFADLHFKKGLRSSDVYIDKLEATMKVHPMRFEKFKGRFHYEDDHLIVENMSGKLGKSEFTLNTNYYFGKDKNIRKRDNSFSLTASHLDFDELFNYNPPPADKVVTPADHENVFNIYDVPFTDMRFDFDIKHLNYHRYLIDNFLLKARSQEDHFIYIDTLSLAAAGGKFFIKGYMNGSDRNKIYFSPQMKIENVDLDKLLFKFENFGQDHLVSENLHGKLSGTLNGKVHLHADMVPILDDSQFKIDFKVVQGRLERYSALTALSDFFKDKNLNNVRFDTLQNTLDYNNGLVSFPRMTINSTLGFIDISGKQDMNMNMEYYISIPWKLVTQVAAQKLFPKKVSNTGDGEDEIQRKDESKKIRYLNLKLTGTPDNYKISLGKDKNASL